MFSCQLGSTNGLFRGRDEMLSGRNEAAPEACELSAANGYASENDAFSFCLVSQSSRKTAQCCLEKNCVRAIERRTTVNSLPEGSHANHEKLYESEKRTKSSRFFIIRFFIIEKENSRKQDIPLK